MKLVCIKTTPEIWEHLRSNHKRYYKMHPSNSQSYLLITAERKYVEGIYSKRDGWKHIVKTGSKPQGLEITFDELCGWEVLDEPTGLIYLKALYKEQKNGNSNSNINGSS